MKRIATALLLFVLAAWPATASGGVVFHPVQPGETLSSIAEACGTTVQALQEANPGVDPRSLRPGTKLRLSPSDRWLRHTVSRGDTLFALARRYGASVEEIQEASNQTGIGLEVGMVLCIPRVAMPPSPPPTASTSTASATQVAPAVPTASPSTLGPTLSAPAADARSTADPTSTPSANLGSVGVEAPLPRWVQIRLPDGRCAWAPTAQMIVASSRPASPARVVEIARQFMGTPYRWGGESPNGVDCSGFVEEVFRLAGYRLPRTADVQFDATRALQEGALQTGDLVFFTTYAAGPSHVGIYVGDGAFIHASSSRGVTESKLDDPYYAKRYLGGRRIADWPLPALSPPIASPTPDQSGSPAPPNDAAAEPSAAEPVP